MSQSDFLDLPPDTPAITDYDRSHMQIYLRLLDAEQDGAGWREVTRIVFDIDPDREPERARKIHDSHLARARWMTKTGYQLMRVPSFS